MRLWSLYSFLVLGFYGCGRKIPKLPDCKKLKNINIEDVYMQWPVYMTWAGGSMVFFGVIWLVWFARKDVGVRLIITGVSLAMVAKVMIWLGDWMWPLVGVCVVLYAVCNPRRVEKALSKIGIFVDIDGDGMIGTGRTAKKAGKKFWWIFRRRNQNHIDTEKQD